MIIGEKFTSIGHDASFADHAVSGMVKKLLIKDKLSNDALAYPLFLFLDLVLNAADPHAIDLPFFSS